MSKIIKFPRSDQAEPAAVSPAVPGETAKAPKRKIRGLFAGVLRFVWVAVVLVWPVLKWIASIAVFFQFIRMLYHWNTPGIYAGWTFLLHFAVLTALTYFVSIYKPKGV